MIFPEQKKTAFPVRSQWGRQINLDSYDVKLPEVNHDVADEIEIAIT